MKLRYRKMFFQFGYEFDSSVALRIKLGVKIISVSSLFRLYKCYALPADGPVGTPARWAVTSNVEGGSGTEKGGQGPLARDGGFYLSKLFARARDPS